MRKINMKFQIMALGALAAGLLSSCSVDVENDLNRPAGNMLAKVPQMLAYSGDHTWTSGNTRGANVNGNMWYQDWDRPTNVTDEEIAKVLEAVKDPRVNAVNDITIEWENFWVQQVYKGQTEYSDYYDTNRGLGSDLMNELSVWNDDVEVWWPEHKFGGYETVNNFNRGDNQTTYTDGENGYVYEGTTLMTGITANGCDSSNQFAYKNSADGSQYYYDYIVIEVDGEYYVCFDFYADNRDNPTATANKDHYIDRDWIFNDWIVKISPAYHKGETPEKPTTPPTDPTDPTDPDQPTTDPTPDDGLCEECHHDHAEGTVCEECVAEGKTGTPCTTPQEGGNDNPTPGEPGDDVANGYDEVEINLSLDEKADKGIRESHLSMHVRSATDVKVFIPVPAQYYCEADDMAIVIEHKEQFVHGGPYSTEYNINGNIVTLNVEFGEDGITIWTDGINQDVIDYCWENYGDGITFEVWNYFNDPETGNPLISMEELKSYLNHATVEFLDKIPGKYINSFGSENGRYENDDPSTHGNNDFHVGPTKQRNEFNEPVQGEHLNGSEYNDIFTKK